MPTIRNCPVCGKETLLIKNIRGGNQILRNGPIIEYEAKCTLCSFSVSNRFRVPEKYSEKIVLWK